MSFIDKPAVTSFDATADKLLDALRGNAVADRLFFALSESANHSLIWHTLTWASVGLKQRSVKNGAFTSLAFGAESGLVNGVIKRYFKRERPNREDFKPHRLRQPKTSSFPSGHATSAMFALMVLGRGKNLVPLLLLALLVSFSRVYVKIHHASDVLGGLVIGLALGALARKILASAPR